MMDQMVLGEQDLEVDIEAGRSDIKQESTSDSERVDFGVPEKIADDLNYPLIRHENLAETSSQSLDLSDKKCDSVKVKKSRKASKPPRPPKSPSLIANDHEVMREIAELAMRWKTKKCLKEQLFFSCCNAGNSSLSTYKSPAPNASPNNQMISVQFYNEFAPVEQTDPSPTTSFRYTSEFRVQKKKTRETSPDESCPFFCS